MHELRSRRVVAPKTKREEKKRRDDQVALLGQAAKIEVCVHSAPVKVMTA